MCNGAVIHKRYCRSHSHFGGMHMLRHIGNISAGSTFHYYCHIWFHMPGCHLRASQTNFLLHSKTGNQVKIISLLQKLKQYSTSCPVIQCLGLYLVVSKGNKRAVKAGIVSKLYHLLSFLFGTSSYIYVHFFLPNNSGSFFGFLQMNGLYANYTGYTVFSNTYPLGKQNPLIDAAYWHELKHPVFRY